MAIGGFAVTTTDVANTFRECRRIVLSIPDVPRSVSSESIDTAALGNGRGFFVAGGSGLRSILTLGTS